MLINIYFVGLPRLEKSKLGIHVVLLGQPAEVDDGVAHTTQGGVDADTCAGGNVFEVALAIVAQDDDAALFWWEHLDEFAYIATSLLSHDGLLDIVVVDAEVVEHVAIGSVGDDRHLAVAAEMVDNQVMGNAHDPMDEFVLVLVGAAVDGGDDLEKSVLEDIVGGVFVLDYGKDVSVNLGLITFQKGIETGVVTISVT